MNKSSETKKIKVAIITNIPTPYRNKQWEYYSKCKYLDITVFYCAKIENDRHWEVDSSKGIKEVFLKGLTYKNYHFNPGILKVILQNYDIFFVGGYGYPSVIMAIAALKLLRKPWVMIIDGISPLNLKKSNLTVDLIKKYFINGAKAYFANGTVSFEYLRNYNVPAEKIFNQYMTVDVDYYIQKESISSKVRNEIRNELGISDSSTVIMYSGRLVEKKGIQDLINATRKLLKDNLDIFTLIVGEGDFKEELKIKSEDITSNLHFSGHINPDQLYKYYYASDIFILPTYDDPWGLVVNEAISCGLPVIVTNAAGCSLDLVKNNGIVIKKRDLTELTSAIENLIENKEFYVKNSLKIRDKWSYKNSLKSFCNLIKFIGTIK